jgi:Asp-tRNA(Asn)/Glu-tRNA(Gln) amidotransferase A subunit family amidase
MNLTQLAQLGVVQLRQHLRAGTARSVDLADALIERTQAHASLNGYVAFDAQAFRAQAMAADARIAAGEDLPLLGVPVALKDNIDAVGLPSAAGTRALVGLRPQHDAEVVQRLRKAGALIAGKANMHELAMGITTNNSVTGAARNPWEPSRIPGGSSGGSGVVVAAGLVPAAIGTDTGGSVRVPAALCGVVGLRPTTGRVPGRGIAPISLTRDTAGPIARSVEDCALLDGVLSGNAQPLVPVSLQGVRLGLPGPGFWEGLEPGVHSVAQEAIERLRTAGAQFVEVPLPTMAGFNEAAGFPIALYEFVRDMGDYLHYAQRGVSLRQLVDAIGSPDVAAIVQPLLGEGAVPEAVYAHALQARRGLQAVYAEAFAAHGVRAFLFPTTPLTAAPVGHDVTVQLNGQALPTFSAFIRNTDPGSNAGIPGVTLPAGLAEGLPVGLGLDGPAGSDRGLLALAAAVEAVLPPLPSAPWLR